MIGVHLSEHEASNMAVLPGVDAAPNTGLDAPKAGVAGVLAAPKPNPEPCCIVIMLPEKRLTVRQQSQNTVIKVREGLVKGRN